MKEFLVSSKNTRISAFEHKCEFLTSFLAFQIPKVSWKWQELCIFYSKLRNQKFEDEKVCLLLFIELPAKVKSDFYDISAKSCYSNINDNIQ
jgi:hypothetical protein